MTSFRCAVAWTALLGSGFWIATPSIAEAQTQAQTTSPAPAPAPAAVAPVQVGFQDGFFIQSPNGDNRLVFGFVAQVDGRFALGDPLPIINTFTLRKFRPTLTGQVAKYFGFKVMPELGSGTTGVADAYLDVRFSQKFRVRSGKDKTPVGYELLQGDAFVWFPERSLASSLVPNRDIGVQLQGDLAGGKVFYAGGVFNGVPDGASSTTELDTNSGKDLTGRIVVQPFRSTATPTGRVNGFGFQIGGSNGRETGALPSFKTSVQQTYFSYVGGANAATADGTRNRVTPAVFYYYKAVGGFAEYMRSTQAVSRSGVRTDVTNHAWDVSGSVMLTGGDTVSYGIIRPHTPFDPPAGHWGALQLIARYAALTVDQGAFDAGLAAATASREAKSFTIGTDWHPNQSVKFYGTYERTTFHGGNAERPTENVILFRTQLGF